MENRKYAKYVNKLVDSLSVNRDPKKFPVWGKVTVPMIFNRSHLEGMPIHIEHLLIHEAGGGWGLNHPCEGVLGGKEFKDLPLIFDIDEIYTFTSTDPKNPHDLGGEIELWIGEGKNAEKYSITESTCVYIPAGLPHMPIYFKRVDRTIIMTVVLVGPLWACRFAKEFPSDCNYIYKGK